MAPAVEPRHFLQTKAAVWWLGAAVQPGIWVLLEKSGTLASMRASLLAIGVFGVACSSAPPDYEGLRCSDIRPCPIDLGFRCARGVCTAAPIPPIQNLIRNPHFLRDDAGVPNWRMVMPATTITSAVGPDGGSAGLIANPTQTSAFIVSIGHPPDGGRPDAGTRYCARADLRAATDGGGQVYMVVASIAASGDDTTHTDRYRVRADVTTSAWRELRTVESMIFTGTRATIGLQFWSILDGGIDYFIANPLLFEVEDPTCTW